MHEITNSIASMGSDIPPKLPWDTIWSQHATLEMAHLAKGTKSEFQSATMLSEEIRDMSVSPPMTIGTPVYEPIGSWGPGYSIDIEDAWFAVGFSVTKGNKLQWKAAAFCPGHNKIIAKERVDVFAQNAESLLFG